MYPPRRPPRRRIERIDRSNVLPYEYDDYYNTRVNRPWGASLLPNFLGFVLISFGILSLIFTSIDISRGASVRPYSQNPNYRTVGIPAVESPFLSANWHENTIWPTMGKGIWVGLLMIFTGILAIISRQDGTQIGVYTFNIMAWITMIFSLFLMLSSIFPIEAYFYNGLSDRTYEQNIEVAMNALLIVCGIVSLIICLIGAILSCIYLDYCSNGREYPKYTRFY